MPHGEKIVLLVDKRDWFFVNLTLEVIINPAIWRNIAVPIADRAFDLERMYYGPGSIRLSLRGCSVDTSTFGDIPIRPGLRLVIGVPPLPKALRDDLERSHQIFQYPVDLK